jgi:hypothetical protein
MGRLGKLLQEIGGTVRTGFINDLIQRLYPFRGLLRIRIHNPLVQFLVHQSFHYNDASTMILRGLVRHLG